MLAKIKKLYGLEKVINNILKYTVENMNKIITILYYKFNYNV